MPTNEERRKVAQKLRNSDIERHQLNPMVSHATVTICGSSIVCIDEESLRMALDYLADLIEPEPTVGNDEFRGTGMSEFVLTESDVFGRYCHIEQLRYGAPNEIYLYKVVASIRSNCWCEVPYKTASKEVRHDSIEDCILAICCGIDETKVLRFRTADVEFLPQKTCNRDALLKLADEMEDRAESYMAQCPGTMKTWVSTGDMRVVADKIRKACG